MSVKHNLDQVQRMIDKANKRLGPFVEDTLNQIGRKILSKVQTNLSGRVLQKRSGRLHGAWGMKIEPIAGGIRLTVGAINDNVPYDEIHDKGGKTGRGHKTKIPARYYYSKVPEEQDAAIDRIITNKLKRLFN